MGEWSKKIGEYGENVVEKFFSVIGWHDMAKGVVLDCINGEKHLNKIGNPKETHGIDFLYSYLNPLVAGQLNNVLISSKFETSKYPNSPTVKFKNFMEDIITTMECYDVSNVKDETLTGFSYSTLNDVGVLFWLNNKADSEDDLIKIVANSRIEDTSVTKTIYIMDNKRVAFILEVMKFVKTKENDFESSFYYPNTGQNINPLERINVGKRLPVEYLNSSIIPIKLSNKNNSKETYLLLATFENFEEGDLMRLMGLAKDIGTELVGKVIIAFADYNELEHKQTVTLAKQKFQSSEFTKNVSVINFLDPSSVF